MEGSMTNGIDSRTGTAGAGRLRQIVMAGALIAAGAVTLGASSTAAQAYYYPYYGYYPYYAPYYAYYPYRPYYYGPVFRAGWGWGWGHGWGWHGGWHGGWHH
jgi:hypothetical protein